MQEEKDPIMKNEATLWESVMTARMAPRGELFAFSVIKIHMENPSQWATYLGINRFGRKRQNWGQ